MKAASSLLLILALFIELNAQDKPVVGAAAGGNDTAAAAETFTNPLLPSGPDPWSIYREGFYYYMHTTGTNLTIWKTRDLADLKTAEKKVVWTPPASGPYSKDIWAPELHFLQGKWYIYFAADAGKNQSHRLWVIENGSADPLLGEWVMKGKLADPSDKWAIDGSVFEHKGNLYLVWSGWEGDTNGRQDIYIARLRNPWTVDGRRVMISSPEHPWEKVGDTKNPEDPPHIDVNEGPQILKHGDRLFLIYSASGCWTEHYALGMLTVSVRRNLLDKTSWRKHPRPVFQQSAAARAYGTGHNSFFKSPDGREDWILYHANSQPNQGCGRQRSPRAQPFTWKADGTPDFGTPVGTGTLLRKPSGGRTGSRAFDRRRLNKVVREADVVR